MKKILAALVIVTATAVVSSSAFAWPIYYPPKNPPKQMNGHHNGHTGKLVVGCIMGSALGAIGTALRVSRAENRELTQQEAWTALSFCGLGSVLVASRPIAAQPQKVVAKY
jgi:hypothetical protein